MGGGRERKINALFKNPQIRARRTHPLELTFHQHTILKNVVMDSGEFLKLGVGFFFVSAVKTLERDSSFKHERLLIQPERWPCL